ncbi:TPA: restriction endonuclease subunit S [Klebsiella pneumoniae]|uniref:restriction endonuclease subunit S n=1 Tax=Klebsiella pneumoniae complex TaxID=3390273 RepID=UPI000847AB36|nr:MULTISPECIES: restriction endonuclease subunit S [Klebsiella]HEP1335394.1 restriction endonuclease subunit S [Klebsiella pneumoniae subsp. pneumoniae]EIX9517166.1 restriction endonuclease subunit S [Klebsiella pneumoniae]MBV0690982.1 restriction endonuclease subunit S [Klebsiella quasipneumoniae]MBW5953609.1 restriction endonuclease subunit S [Klebsiella pneumoniae]MBX4811688.1 restriction endonuclease subunit S [Klebsiella pneumoniae]
MNKLSYLEKLLDGVEVEWKTLEKVLKRTKGTKITAGQMKALHKDNAPLKIFAGGKTVAFVDFKDIPEKDINREPSIIVKSRGIIEFEYYDKPFSHKNEMWSYHSDNDAISIKYIYYFLKINEGYFQKIGGKMQMPQIATPDTDKFEVPIPCPDNPEKSLAIQSEIVRILDTFTALITELTTELTMRKKQYNYYRDQLLSFDEGEVEWKTLGDVTKKWYSGGTPTAGKAEYYENGEIPWLRTQEVKFSDINSTEIKITQAALKNSAAKWIPENCVIIAISGATAGRSAINKIPLTTNQHCGCLEIDDTKALYRYVFHWVSFNYENIKSLGQGARGDLNSTIIKNFKLPIPYATAPDKSLEEQARIVEILDKFDTLTNSITEGLPREIELRQKQYEYYRDLLFSFPKPEATSN